MRGSVTEALSSTRGFFDASGNSVLGDRALIDVELGEQVEQLELSVPTLKKELPKVHKRLHCESGRNSISDCGTRTEKVPEILDH